MKKYLLIFVFIYGVSATLAFAATAPTTGLIAGQIWFSKQPLVEGDTVKVYTAIWNQDTNPLQARVEFYDQDVVLGARDVTVPGQTLKDVSVGWQVTSGDHLLSAKILSSSVTVNGKAQTVTLDHSTTDVDHEFVPVTVKAPDGVTLPNANIVKNEISTLGAQVNAAIPPSVSSNVNSVDNFRAATYSQIEKSKTDTQNKIKSFNSVPSKGKNLSNPQSGIEKPIAYVKLFLLTLAGFIFGSKIVFYSLIALLVFLILRFLYRKIRHR